MINLACRLSVQLITAMAQRLPIVIYHRVLSKTDPVLTDVPTIEEFTREIKWLKGSFNVLPLELATRLLFDGRLPKRSLCITFDDGYRDNLQNALPVLIAHDACATFFVTTAYMDGGMMWNDRIIESIRACPSDQTSLDLSEYGMGCYELAPNRSSAFDTILGDLKYRPFEEREAIAKDICDRHCDPKAEKLMMNADEIAELHASGMEIGGHTHSHPILSQLTAKHAFSEIKTNKDTLEDIIGKPLRSFAYPNGRPDLDYRVQHADMLKEMGFDIAVSTSAGAASKACDPFQIPRFSPWDKSQTKYNLRMMRNYFGAPNFAK